MNKENTKKLLLVNMSTQLNLTFQEIEKAMMVKCGHGLLILNYLQKEKKRYTKLMKDYEKILASARVGSGIITVYCNDKKYLEAIDETIEKINVNYKKNNNGR